MVLQASRMTNTDTSPMPMDSYQTLHRKTGSTSSSSSTPPRSASPMNNQEDSFRRMIFEKIEEGKRDIDPQKCRKILEDLMKMLKHLTADVNNYNLAFRETRPAFYMQVGSIRCGHVPTKPINAEWNPCFSSSLKEFERLTDRIDTLTKARDALTEYLREVEDQHVDRTLTCSTSIPDVSQPAHHSPIERSSSDKQFRPPKFSLTSPPFNTKDIVVNDYSSSNADQRSHQHSYPLTPPSPSTSSHTSSQQAHYYNSRSRSPSMTPGQFIRVHFPNKHTTAVIWSMRCGK